MFDLDGKVILVTGAGSGIGLDIAQAAARAGAQVALLDWNGEAAQAAAASCPGARAYKADVTDADAMEAVCGRVAADFGRLDGAVNNAGISGELAVVTQASLANWRRVIDVNLSGVYYSVRAQIPHLLASGGGSIVNMASMAGVLGETRLAAYTASKHGVVGLTKVVALEYARQGIRCNAVCPSFVKTPMVMADVPEDQWPMIDAMHPIGRAITLAEVTSTTLFLLSPLTGATTGSVHLLDGGVAAH